MPKTCLAIVFNHRFEQNLPKLRTMYGERFENLRFLMPFPHGTADDVIPIYESSYRFHGLFAQAWPSLEDVDCDHYAFVGDDFVLNPSLDESNLHEALRLDEGTSYISDLLPVRSRQRSNSIAPLPTHS